MDPDHYVSNISVKYKCITMSNKSDIFSSFICVVILYLAVGSIVNVALGKRTATEIFPNYSLWIKFILLIVVS